MISATIADDGRITAELFHLQAGFDPIDEDDIDADVLDDKPKKVTKKAKSKSAIFYVTGYGSDTFEKPEADKKKTTVKKATAKKEAVVIEPLDDKISDQQRVEFYTRAYEPSRFDKNPRPQWTPPRAANDNKTRKHSFPALDEARNNKLMEGHNKADTLLKNEWALDILLEVGDLMDAATPASAWLQHDGHGETDEHEVGDDANPGHGLDVKHDYGPSENKVKRLWEHGNDNKLSKEEALAQSLGYVPQWNLGAAPPDPTARATSNPKTKSKADDAVSTDRHLIETVMSDLETGKLKKVKLLRQVGGLEFNELNQVTDFCDKKGNWLKFKTKTRGAKGRRVHPKVIPDPKDTHEYDGARLPRNKKGELTAGFFAGKTGSSNSVEPDTLDFEPIAGPSNSYSDPWAAEIAAENARDDATIKLVSRVTSSQH